MAKRAEAEKNFEVVKKYYVRKNGVLESQGYDWIGDACGGDLYPVDLNEKLGFLDSNGEIVIPAIYDRGRYLNNTVILVSREYLDLKKNNLCGLIRHDGSLVVDFCWDDMDLSKLSEDLLPVAINNKWGYVNVKTGKTQIEPAYDEVEFFKNGFAPVRVDETWGMIDTNGNMIVKPKLLLDTYFEDDFAIVFEGGSWEYYFEDRNISNSNCKIINKKGYEIVSDCCWIERTGINTFTLTRSENDQTVETVMHFIPFPDYIVVIKDGKYRRGYITPKGKYCTRWVYDKKLQKGSTEYDHAKYVGGGTWSAMDYSGKPIEISNEKLKEIKNSLLA